MLLVAALRARGASFASRRQDGIRCFGPRLLRFVHVGLGREILHSKDAHSVFRPFGSANPFASFGSRSELHGGSSKSSSEKPVEAREMIARGGDERVVSPDDARLQSVLKRMESVSSKDVVSALHALENASLEGFHAESAEKNVRLLLCLGIRVPDILKVYKRSRLFVKPHSFEKLIPNILLLFDHGLSQIQVTRGLVAYPDFVGFRPLRIRESLEYFLEKHPGLNVGKMFSYYPHIFCFGISALESKFSYFSALGFKDVAKLFQDNPFLLNRRVSSIEEKVEYYRSLLGAEEANRFLQRSPQILRSNLQTVGATHQWLQDKFGPDHVARFIRTTYQILSQSVEVLEEKFNFVHIEMQRSVSEIAKCPNVLAYSYRRRLIPRYFALKRANLEKGLSLRAIYFPTDADFEKKFGVKLQSMDIS